MRKIICHAGMEYCPGCAHYRGESPLCEFANGQDELAALRAENERLKEALRNAVVWAEAYDPDWVEEARRLLGEK